MTFCSFTFLFPLKDRCFGIKTRNYITSLTLSNLQRLWIKYDEFIQEGSLIIMEAPFLDLMEVYEDLYNFIDESEYEVLTGGYDPYYAKILLPAGKENSSFGVVKVPQGAETESVPLGELKKLSEERMLLFDEEL